MIPRLVIASKNEAKIAEIERLITSTGFAEEIVRGLDWSDIEETADTLIANALLKGRAVTEATGLPCLADDTGLEVAALGGQPGVHTARYGGSGATCEDNVAKLLSELGSTPERRATFRTAVALVFPDGVEVTAEGALEGLIASEPRGSGGFGYDPVFEVDGLTLAEMGFDVKNSLSHRVRAVTALMEAVGL